jgi:hypothetical protein
LSLCTLDSGHERNPRRETPTSTPLYSRSERSRTYLRRRR